jgi:assimilatory nitrate reductase catalytic subunit
MFRSWSSPEAVFQILKRLSRGRPFDFTGIEDYVMIDREGGIQWPLPEGAKLESGERRLFEDGRFFTPDGKAKFFFAEPRPMPEECNVNYPLLLLTGRGSSSQWHTQTRTKRSAVLNKLSPAELYVEISVVDARARDIGPDETVEVSSQRGRVTARAVVTNSVRPGEVFMPMHYDGMNRLTFPSFDPYSRQPSYKAAAVNISKRVQR